MNKLLFVLLFVYYCANAQEWTLYTQQTHPIPNDHIHSVFIDNNNIKWFGTDAGLVSCDGDNWYTHSLENKIFSITGYSDMICDIFWITTDAGLFLIKANTASDIQILNEYHMDNSDIISNFCTSFVVGDQGYNWIGSDVGLSVFDSETWLSFSEKDSIVNVQSELISIVPFNKVMDIKHRENGMVNADNTSAYEYIATQGGGINRLKYNDVDGMTGASKFDTEWSLLPSDTINTIFFDAQNIAWYGTNYGLSMHSGDNIKRNWETFSTEDGLVNDTVLTIIEDHNSNIWIGTVKGVSRYDRESWISWSTATQSAGDSAMTIAQDNDKSIWIGTNQGILNMLPGETSVENLHYISSAHEFNLCNYPNPFNPVTQIVFRLTKQVEVELNIYNTLGEKVRTLVNKSLTSGFHTVTFNGLDDHGHKLSSGIYVYQLQAGDLKEIKKMLMVK